MKKKFGGLALALGAALCAPVVCPGISLDDIQLWSGSGTNRAALVIEWSSPKVFNETTVPAPAADKTMVWGFRFNGQETGTDLLNAALRADPRLYVVEDNSFGVFVVGIGYNLRDDGLYGLTDGTNTDSAALFIQGVLTNATVDMDAARPLEPGDLYWGGHYGPNWEVWNEAGDAGGFLASPNRGTNAFWTADDPSQPYSGEHGQWEYAQDGLDDLPLTNGSWIGYSVAAGGFDYINTNDPGTIAYNTEKHAPPSPEGNYFAYVYDPNDFATSVVAATNLDASSPYNDPAAMLGRPTLSFLDYFGDDTLHRTKIIEAPYWKDANGSNVITEILADGAVTLRLGRRIYDDPNHPYGADLMVYGNSFFSASGASGFIGDDTDLNTTSLSSGYFGHGTLVSVSQDGTNWFAFTNEAALFPDDAYRWDDTNASWTDETLNPTRPLAPSVTAAGALAGETVATALDQFAGASGGSAYDLKETGLPWIQYVRLAPAPGSYTVIDAIAGAKPAVVGDELALSPNDLTAGAGALVFENPAVSNEVSVVVNAHSLGGSAKISTARLTDLSPFAPVPGMVSSAFQLAALSASGGGNVSLTADISTRVGDGYNGTGGDLRVWQWNAGAWNPTPFSYNAANREVTVSGATNLTAFVVSQYVPPVLAAQTEPGGYRFTFAPQPYVTYTLERSATLGPGASWTALSSVTPTNTQTVALHDDSSSGVQAFYRLQLSP
jgi:hypothetical protein